MKCIVKNQQSKTYSKKLDSGSTKFTYSVCGKQGHIEMDCPSLTNKDKGQEKKSNRVEKTRRAYIAWEDNATSSSNYSQEEIEANLCLMAVQKYKVSSVNSITSFNSDNYSLLLQAFLESHEEANRLALYNNRLKGLNNWLEGGVKELANELLKLKTDFDHLEMIYKSAASDDFDSCRPTNCENCVVLKNKVNYLIKTASRLYMRITNLNTILRSQNCVFQKASIGYQCGFQGKQKKFNRFFKHDENHYSPLSLVFIVRRKASALENVKSGSLTCLKVWLGGCLKASLTLLDPSLIGYQLLKRKMFCKSV